MTKLRSSPALIALLAAVTLGGCASMTSINQEAGACVDEGGFGNPTMNNTLVMNGTIDARMALATRFAKEIDSTINFDFNSAELTADARTTLAQQALWIRQFPEVTFRVYGHTDLVGSDAYNKALGLRRAQAAVSFLTTQGIGGARLEAVVSYGKTRPLVQTPGPEEQNRRTVTEVSGFVGNNPLILNGKYAEIIWRDYIVGAAQATTTTDATSKEATQ
jgi:peptidoglycan-associated lipoprotein